MSSLLLLTSKLIIDNVITLSLICCIAVVSIVVLWKAAEVRELDNSSAVVGVKSESGAIHKQDEQVINITPAVVEAAPYSPYS